MIDIDYVLSVDVCEGRGVLELDPTRVQLLESQLANLAPRLGSLTVLLRAAVLPCMSLVNPQAAARLQVTCSCSSSTQVWADCVILT